MISESSESESTNFKRQSRDYQGLYQHEICWWHLRNWIMKCVQLHGCHSEDQVQRILHQCNSAIPSKLSSRNAHHRVIHQVWMKVIKSGKRVLIRTPTQNRSGSWREEKMFLTFQTKLILASAQLMFVFVGGSKVDQRILFWKMQKNRLWPIYVYGSPEETEGFSLTCCVSCRLLVLIAFIVEEVKLGVGRKKEKWLLNDEVIWNSILQTYM